MKGRGADLVEKVVEADAAWAGRLGRAQDAVWMRLVHGRSEGGPDGGAMVVRVAGRRGGGDGKGVGPAARHDRPRPRDDTPATDPGQGRHRETDGIAPRREQLLYRRMESR